ncbi:hypothetical protein J4573_18185 [Actinomadura barringtoniae]|uniref:Uncharacterized protein n=1 Tax=Actinomadura barringtoniae TaxID=1427535 RepID=A0A939PAV0_9ACTN|nr:hypothetical protein [Actinomadura barringtoniae]MBO2449038.1 hypothetical protein [Actinomadura barringtoniae]
MAIVKACEQAGMAAVPLPALHAIAYFADALAPIWNIPVVEAQVLKRAILPLNPELQRDIDELVGMAVLIPTQIQHIQTGDGWRLDAEYSLNSIFSSRIIDAMSVDEGWSRELLLAREVTLALAGLGTYGIAGAVLVDATYSDPLLDTGNVVDLAPESAIPTRTAQVTERFATLMAGTRDLTDSELTHLYVRHLYAQLGASGDA